MQLDEFQAAALRTANPDLDAPDALLDAAAGLAEEAGEVLALVRKHRFQHHALDRQRLREELGDALWCLAAACAFAELTLGEVASANLAKLQARYPGTG